jgi:hypothetical protein
MNRRHFIKLGVVGTGAAITGIQSLEGRVLPRPPPGRSQILHHGGHAHQRGPARNGRPGRDVRRHAEPRRGERAVSVHLFPRAAPRRSRAWKAGGGDFHGGNYAMPHMEFYKDTQQDFADMRAPEFGDVDVLARVIPVGASTASGCFPFCWKTTRCPPPCRTGRRFTRWTIMAGPRASIRAGRASTIPATRISRWAGGGLRALLRHRRHHVGLGTPERISQHARHFAEQRRGSGADDVLLRVLPEKGHATAALTWSAPASGFDEMENFSRATAAPGSVRAKKSSWSCPPTTRPRPSP